MKTDSMPVILMKYAKSSKIVPGSLLLRLTLRWGGGRGIRTTNFTALLTTKDVDITPENLIKHLIKWKLVAEYRLL